MKNYIKVVNAVRQYLTSNHVVELIRMVQNFREGNALLQLAVAEIELENNGVLPQENLDTLLEMRDTLSRESKTRMLTMDELHLIWYVDSTESPRGAPTPLERILRRACEQAALGNALNGALGSKLKSPVA